MKNKSRVGIVKEELNETTKNETHETISYD